MAKVMVTKPNSPEVLIGAAEAPKQQQLIPKWLSGHTEYPKFNKNGCK